MVASALLVFCLAFGASEIASVITAGIAGGITAMIPLDDLTHAVRARDWHSLAVAPGAGTGIVLAVVMLLGITAGKALFPVVMPADPPVAVAHAQQPPLKDKHADPHITLAHIPAPEAS